MRCKFQRLHVEGAAERCCTGPSIAASFPADTPVDLLLDSLYGAIVIRMILSPPGQRAQLAAEPYRYAAAIVDFVLSGLPGARPTGVHGASPGSRDAALAARPQVSAIT